MSVIAVEKVWKFYGDYAALRDITLSVENGCCLAARPQRRG
jgi:ABC-type multidrug transport system ATPase subunit